MIPLQKPLIVFDGNCGFCRAWVEYWHTLTKEWCDYKPYQEVWRDFPEIGADNFMLSVYLIFPDGTHMHGARAVYELLAAGNRKPWLRGFYTRFPPFAWFSEACYVLIARNRPLFSWLTRFFWR